ncbi:hypothetical protein UP10_27200 [Bradyrhizobium sp. LTSPM299]|uniref:DUF2278 family protein n=1 Tax=Bradyrhizobium sp. LTSPM299 TaxID=1619233 RepID=UPI0005C88820|nr:DUF2278 family protein [Bradyrhizobium sp. LTSPM299]KJC57930.1 hypothetical protein UP10_27200 [Bradyrhizobium sp. LTSPM299]
MTLVYGFVKTKVTSEPKMKPSHRGHETQFHLHCNLDVDGAKWDVAINVGTNDADDLLKYKLVFDFRHPIIQTLAAANSGSQALTGQKALPALDFLRSDLLANTGKWRDSDVMDGSDDIEPAASLKRLLSRAHQESRDVYIFGRFFEQGDGLHDVHLNQGSSKGFVHRPGDDSNDHNDVWQDGAVMVDLGEPEWAAYVSAFNQQLVPTDDLGNPLPDAATIS